METDFQIVTTGIPATVDEWFRSREAPEEDLPEMTEKDWPRAKLRFMDELEYRRHLALHKFAAERETEEAQALGKRIQSFLPVAGGGTLESLNRVGKVADWQAFVRQSGNGQEILKTVFFWGDALMMNDSDFSTALKEALQSGQEVRAAG